MQHWYCSQFQGRNCQHYAPETLSWCYWESLAAASSGASHKCDVDIRMALQSDLIRAVFIQRRPGHFILLPTFNFKLKPLVPAQDVSPCRCLAKRLSGNIIQHVIFNRQIQFANNNTSPVKHEWMQYIEWFIYISLCVMFCLIQFRHKHSLKPSKPCYNRI